MRSEQEIIKLFDEAKTSGKTFDEAIEISGYKEILDDEAIEDFREIEKFFDDANKLLDEFSNHPEWDREILTPLREILEQTSQNLKNCEEHGQKIECD